MNTPLLKDIDWVGYVDWNVRDFHSYDAERGVTYNAYLIRDEQPALIDAVKAPHGAALIENISGLTDPEKIKYIVCNHAELDHAGSLPEVLAACPKATVICNKKCAESLGRHFDTSSWSFHTVKSGDELSIGRRTLRFIDTPMVHWPESMFTYSVNDRLLFSMDAFGQHYASSVRFDDEAPLDLVMDEAKTYYANIISPYGKPVARTLKALSDLPVEIIAPSHGVIWRKNLDRIVRAYEDWSQFKPKPKVLVVYDTMWESTAAMARAILEGAIVKGIEVKLMFIRASNLTRIAAEVLDAACVAFGCSTLNSTLMPAAAAALTYLKGLRMLNKSGFAFGSWGWSKGGPQAVDEYLKAMKWEILREPLDCQYRPTTEILDACRKAGAMLAVRAKEVAK
jgi:flavorubredoxin